MAEEDQNATFADEGPGGELVELGAFERWIEGPAEVFKRAGITESDVLAPLFDEALVPGVEFVLAEQLEAKQLFNLSPDNAQSLKSTAGISGLTKSQIVNDTLKVHFGTQDPMIATRLDVVRAARCNSGPQKPTREATPPPSGARPNRRPPSAAPNPETLLPPTSLAPHHAPIAPPRGPGRRRSSPGALPPATRTRRGPYQGI